MLTEGNYIYNQLWIRYCIGRIETSFNFSTWKISCPKLVTTKVHMYLLLYIDILNMKLVPQELRLLYQLINVTCVFMCVHLRYILIIMYTFIRYARSDYLL